MRRRYVNHLILCIALSWFAIACVSTLALFQSDVFHSWRIILKVIIKDGKTCVTSVTVIWFEDNFSPQDI